MAARNDSGNQAAGITPANGKLGVMIVGMGAVATRYSRA